MINRRANSHEKNKSSIDFRTAQKTVYWHKNRNQTLLHLKIAQKTTLFQRSTVFLIKSLFVLPFLDVQDNKSRSVVTILSEITWLLWYMKYKVIASINNEIYLYEMLTTNLLQAMLVREAEQSHQHWQSSNSALLTRWAHTQSKSEAMTTRSSTRWSLHIRRMTATSLHTRCSLYTTHTHILRRHDSAFAHIQTDVMQ